MVNQPEMLRAEARFALMCGFILLALGLALALGFTLYALVPNSGGAMLAGAWFGGPPIFVGYLICRYAAWRLEEARRLEIPLEA